MCRFRNFWCLCYKDSTIHKNKLKVPVYLKPEIIKVLKHLTNGYTSIIYLEIDLEIKKWIVLQL